MSGVSLSPHSSRLTTTELTGTPVNAIRETTYNVDRSSETLKGHSTAGYATLKHTPITERSESKQMASGQASSNQIISERLTHEQTTPQQTISEQIISEQAVMKEKSINLMEFSSEPISNLVIDDSYPTAGHQAEMLLTQHTAGQSTASAALSQSEERKSDSEFDTDDLVTASAFIVDKENVRPISPIQSKKGNGLPSYPSTLGYAEIAQPLNSDRLNHTAVCCCT